MPAAVPLLGAATTIYGASQSRRASRDAANAQNRALDQARTQLNPFSIMGFGGMGAGYGMPAPGGGIRYGHDMILPGQDIGPEGASLLGRIPGSSIPQFGNGTLGGPLNRLLGRFGEGAGTSAGPANSIGLNAGDLEGVRAALSQYATGSVPGAGNALPPEVAHALGIFGAASGAPIDMGTSGLDMLSGDVNSQFMDASNAFRTAAGSPSSYNDVYNNTLTNLRNQAATPNNRAFANLQDNLFSTGRMGSSGGALQTEAFARGLADADAGYQLQAQNQAMATRSQEDQLLNSAFGRFQNTAGMARDLNTERFARSMYGDERQYGRAQNWLGTNVNMAGLPASLQGANLQNVLAALGAQSGIQSQALELFGAGLSAEQAAANARIGAGSNMSRIVGSPAFGAPGQANAGMWAQLGTSLMNPNGMGGVLGQLFGNRNNIESVDPWAALDQSGFLGG